MAGDFFVSLFARSPGPCGGVDAELRDVLLSALRDSACPENQTFAHACSTLWSDPASPCECICAYRPHRLEQSDHSGVSVRHVALCSVSTRLVAIAADGR